MKPWEETWTTDGDGVIYAEPNTPAARLPSRFAWEQATNFGAFGNLREPGGGFNATDEDNARAELASAAPDMARVLLAIEWEGSDDFVLCPCCKSRAAGLPDRQHAADCALDAALRKAGIR